jgi:hypothetical protein
VAYSRWSTSDTYFYRTRDSLDPNKATFSCDCCILHEDDEKICTEIVGFPNAIRHILDHIEAGSDVDHWVVAALADRYCRAKDRQG